MQTENQPKEDKNGLLRLNRRSGVDVRFCIYIFFGSALETKGYCYVPLFGMLLVCTWNRTVQPEGGRQFS